MDVCTLFRLLGSYIIKVENMPMFMKKLNCNHMSAVLCLLINFIHLSNYNNNNTNSSWPEEEEERETGLENSVHQHVAC